MPPRVTWMIPVLNGMPYLRETLASIQSQTFKDFDVVVWDNGSTDGTLDELANWIPGKLPGRVECGRPLSLGLSRAAMIAESNSELCALIDADDTNEPTRLEKQVEFLDQHPEVAVVGTQLNRLGVDGENFGPLTHYPLGHAEIVQEMLMTNPIGQPSVLMRREAVVAAGNYHDVKVEDYQLWLRMAARGYRMANLPDFLVNYRVHPQSTTYMQTATNRLEGLMLEHLAESAPELFACDGNSLRSLRRRSLPHAIGPLRKIARQISDGGNPWHSPVFYRAARSMIANDDRGSRVSAAYEARGAVGALSEIKSIGANAVRRILRKVFRSSFDRPT